MHPAIIVRTDHERGCGFRKKGGIYLVCDAPARHCGKMPIPLGICPCCGQGIKPSRAPLWIEQPERLWESIPCECSPDVCRNCPMSRAYETGAALLIWVGSKFYPTTEEFNRESRLMGISRRIAHIPKNFQVGETWVLLAHRNAIDAAPVMSAHPDWKPGIFAMFQPTRLEIVVRGDEPDDVIEDYIKRGLTPVMIQRQATSSEPQATQQGLL